MMKNNKPLILAVDDNPHNLQVLGNILEENGYEPAVLLSGLEVIDFLKSEKPDLILLDVMMPEVNGYEVCRKLKSIAEFEDIPVIFLTAKIETDDIIKGFEAGAIDYITKPFKKAELLARINTQIQLRKSQSDLQHSNNIKDKVFSIIAHDLRGLFNTLLGFSNMVVDDFEELSQEDIKDANKKIFESTKTAFNILDNMLEWVKLQRNKSEYNPTFFQLKDVVDDTLKMYSIQLEEKNISLRNNINNIKVCADLNMFNTIIRNILSNAIKYSYKNGEILFTTEIDKDSFIIIISDNGIGMNQEIVDKLFNVDEFHSTRGTENEKGTGLGLKLCKDFIDRHNGKIWVESKLNKGSKFFIKLPMDKVKSSD